jgi:hypothetical protein
MTRNYSSSCGRLLIILAALFMAAGCSAAEPMNDITQVSYTSDAGTILPELQWHEQIIITKGKVSLARNGRVADTRINAGNWEIPVDAEHVQALFEQLATVDCSVIKRVAPDDLPDGGSAESYTIAYALGKKCSLEYAPGTTYTNGEMVVKPIEAFIQSLNLPADAASRYQPPDS